MITNNDDHWDGWNSQHVNEYEFDESNEIALIYKLSALTEKLAVRLQASLNSQKMPEEIGQEIKHLRKEYDRLENYRQATINYYRDKMGEEVPEALLKPRVQSQLFRPSRPQTESPPANTTTPSHSNSGSRRTSGHNPKDQAVDSHHGKPHSTSKSKINVLHRGDKDKDKEKDKSNQPAPLSSPFGGVTTANNNSNNTSSPALGTSNVMPTNSGKFISPRSTGARPINDNNSPSSPKQSPSQTPTTAPTLHLPLITPLDLSSAHNSPCLSRETSRPSSPHHTPPLSPVSMHREEARQAALSATALANSLQISGLVHNNTTNNGVSSTDLQVSPRTEKAKNIKFNVSSPRSPRTTSLSRPIGTSGLCLSGMTTEEMESMTVSRGANQAAYVPMTSLSHAPTPLTQSPGLATPTYGPNQSLPPTSPLPPLPAITAPAPEPAMPSPTWRREVSSEDDGYHNQSHSESSSEFQKNAAAFPIAPPKASTNSRRRPSNSAQKSSDPESATAEAGKEDAGEKNFLVSPSDDNANGLAPSVHISDSNHPDFDNPQTRELREKLLHQILSHSQLQHQHLRPVQPAITTAMTNTNNTNTNSNDPPSSGSESATPPTRRVSSPLESSNKVSRVTQPPRRLRVESCGPRERSSILHTSDETRERNKIAQPGTLNLSAPEVASAQRAYPISEPPSPNNRHRMRSKSKDNQLHSEIINFRRNRNNNTNTASNDASSNANSGSSITEEQ